VVNYGTANAGLIYMTASEANAPYLSVMTHAGAPWAALSTNLRIGNLNGYLGYVADVYGMGIGSIAAGEANLTFDPTNGLRLRQAAVDMIVLDMAGGAKIGGFYFSVNDIWGGNAAIGNAATTIVMGNLDGVSKIALGPSADAITVAGVQSGFIADGGGNLRVGDVNSFIRWSGGALAIQLASGEAMTLSAGGDIVLVGDNVDAAKVIFRGTTCDLELCINAAGSNSYLWPTVDDTMSLDCGHSTKRYTNITNYASEYLAYTSYVDANNTAAIQIIHDVSAFVYVYLQDEGVMRSVIFQYENGGIQAVYPGQDNEWDFGTVALKWKDGRFAGNIILASMAAGGNRYVYVDNNGLLTAGAGYP